MIPFQKNASKAGSCLSYNLVQSGLLVFWQNTFRQYSFDNNMPLFIAIVFVVSTDITKKTVGNKYYVCCDIRNFSGIFISILHKWAACCKFDEYINIYWRCFSSILWTYNCRHEEIMIFHRRKIFFCLFWVWLLYVAERTKKIRKTLNSNSKSFCLTSGRRKHIILGVFSFWNEDLSTLWDRWKYIFFSNRKLTKNRWRRPEVNVSEHLWNNFNKS